MMRAIEHLIETIEALFFRTNYGPSREDRRRDVERDIS